MAAANFMQKDFDNLELVRQIVLRRLKDGKWNQLYEDWDERNAGEYVRFERPELRNRFMTLVVEVMWQFIIQGVVTPGMDAPNPELPWFRVTSYGKKVLEEERFLPHDPTGYLIEIGKVNRTEVGNRALPYLEEALRCFTSGCNVAAVLMLGVAAEATFLALCAVVEAAFKDPAEAAKFQKLLWVKAKHRRVVEIYQGVPAADRKAKLPESLDVTLTSLYDLIRRQRNDLGHPSDQPPEMGREQAFVLFKLFPTFIADAEKFAEYCRSQQI